MLRFLRRRKRAEDTPQPTRFEQAYIDLYNDVIPASRFAAAAGIPDKEQAWRQLEQYRLQVLQGVIDDPRDKYNKWR